MHMGTRPGPTHHPPPRVTPMTESFRGTIPTITVISTKPVSTRKAENRPTESKGSNYSTGSLSFNRTGGSRRLSDAKIARRRELGLCFKYRDKFGPGHVCKNKNLHLIVLEMEAERERGGSEDGMTEGDSREGEEEAAGMMLSLNSMSRFGNNHTMKVRGRLNEKELVVLIDSGATHNFISKALLADFPLEKEEIAEYQVIVGDGYSVRRKQRCKDVKFSIQGLEITQTFYPFPLSGIDMVLGVEWLKSLGEVKMNWGQLTMKIGKKGSRICLQREPTLGRTQASLKALLRSVKKQGEGYLIEYRGLTTE